LGLNAGLRWGDAEMKGPGDKARSSCRKKKKESKIEETQSTISVINKKKKGGGETHPSVGKDATEKL